MKVIKNGEKKLKSHKIFKYKCYSNMSTIKNLAWLEMGTVLKIMPSNFVISLSKYISYCIYRIYVAEF